MEYLEKGLKAVKETYVNSLLEFYENNPLKHISLNCDKIVQDTLDELQINIFGQVCGSFKTGKKTEMNSTMCFLRKISPHLLGKC